MSRDSHILRYRGRGPEHNELGVGDQFIPSQPHFTDKEAEAEGGGCHAPPHLPGVHSPLSLRAGPGGLSTGLGRQWAQALKAEGLSGEKPWAGGARYARAPGGVSGDEVGKGFVWAFLIRHGGACTLESSVEQSGLGSRDTAVGSRVLCFLELMFSRAREKIHDE